MLNTSESGKKVNTVNYFKRMFSPLQIKKCGWKKTMIKIKTITFCAFSQGDRGWQLYIGLWECIEITSSNPEECLKDRKWNIL